jgi:hypothetical protein
VFVARTIAFCRSEEDIGFGKFRWEIQFSYHRRVIIMRGNIPSKLIVKCPGASEAGVYVEPKAHQNKITFGNQTG